MTGTRAIPTSVLDDANVMIGPPQPLCPACKYGRLHPYVVEIRLSTPASGPVEGSDYLTGWVAICVGNKNNQEVDEQTGPCGFSMPMTPHLFPNRRITP